MADFVKALKKKLSMAREGYRQSKQMDEEAAAEKKRKAEAEKKLKQITWAAPARNKKLKKMFED